MVYEWKGDPTTEAALVEAGTLVPVKRCEHGNIFRHIIDRPEKQGFVIEWCPGVKIGDNDE